MADEDALKSLRRSIPALIRPYRVSRGKRFRLKDYDPADTGRLESAQKQESQELLQAGIAELSRQQEMLYAQDNWALLLVFQAMDAAGKDGTIAHVLSGVNPQGCQVFSFKQPSAEELDHDFLWRTNKALPERGRIGIFNRSYYEEVLVVRVHPELLAHQHMHPSLLTRDIWQERFEDINAHELHLARNGVAIRKFFLHVSKKEQRKRFLERIDDPDKNWKFSMADAAERDRWQDYMAAYEDMIRNTATPHAPWFVVPADNKWYTRLVVAAAVVDALHGLDLHFPRVGDAKRRELQELRKVLTKDAKPPRKDAKPPR